MADDQKPTNLASGGIIVASLAVVGSLFFAHEAPLQGSRPAMSEPQFHQSATSQDIDARLWQDPFAAVAKSLDSRGDSRNRSSAEEHCIQNPDGPHCASPLTGKHENTLVIAVTMSGAPYAEENEARRRTRFAVLAGLKRAGFVPEDAQHIGYFEWLPQGLAQPSNRIPTEVWLRPIHELMLPPVVPDQMTTVVPYERFRPIDLQSSERTSKRILVVWLDEDALHGSPLDKLAGLAKFLRSRSDPSVRADRQIRILGPQYSDTLHAMAIEARSFATENCDVKKEPWPDLEGVQFYTYSASAEDIQLLRGLTTTCTSVHDYFANLGIDIRRTIATDEVLARGIVGELELRGVKPGVPTDQPTDHVALISEWDTFYGRTVPDTMERCFENPDCSPKQDSEHPPWVHRLTYLRGLDGQLPGTPGTEDRKTGKGTGEADRKASATDFFKTKSDVNGGDRPNGQGQQDYLRRLADHLRKIDEKLRRDNEGRIRAIGILGSDVFDKLLVLRALRPKFPEALFFTTDFDATLTMGSELDWTRNLIVASSFGPELVQEIQDEIPPFRGSYQPAAFLATRLAIGDPDNNWCIKVGQDHLTRWLSRARIVEIERTGDVLSFPVHGGLDPERPPPPEACPEPAPGDNFQRVAASTPLREGRSVSGSCTEKDLSSCDDIQPPKEDLFPEPRNPAGLKSIAWTLAGAALLVLSALSIGRVRKRAGLEVGLVGLILFGGAFASAFWTQIATTLTGNGEGEPIALLQGVSVWPTVLLRALSIVLSAYLIWRAWRKLDANLYEIARDMQLPMPNSAINAERTADTERRLWKKFLRIFSYSLRERQADGREPDDINTAWSEYVYQGRWGARLFRVAIYVTAWWYILVKNVVMPIVGKTITPTRGLHTWDAFMYTSRVDFICQLALMFLVFDATLLCLLFVKELRRGSRQWPDETRRLYQTRLGLEDQFVDEWIDLDFVAKRTRCISTLIYYPFILIALLIVSRSTVFANYPPSVPMFVVQGFSLTIVFGCALALCLTAQAARSTAKQRLTDRIICAKGPCGKDLDDGGRRAGQLETLLVRVDDLRDGAFSPLTQQPFARALLLPLGSFGWTTLLQNGMLPGL
ncbi:MAG: hypothetical protein ACREC9_05700 [Methylocella sp.]